MTFKTNAVKFQDKCMQYGKKLACSIIYQYSTLPEAIIFVANFLHAAYNYNNIRWRCPDDSCKKSCSVRLGSFFEKSKLSLQQWVVIIHWWVREYPVTRAAEEAKVTEMTAIQCYQYLRDVCSWRLTSVDSPLLLGGQGVVVQIDESLFRHKPKVNIERFRATSNLL